jgi:hypothetical protein
MAQVGLSSLPREIIAKGQVQLLHPQPCLYPEILSAMLKSLPPKATGLSVWNRLEMEQDKSWVFRLSDEDLRELESATTALHDRGVPPLEFRQEDFPLSTLGPKIARLLEEIEYGRGFVLMRGLNVADYALDKLSVLYWGLGTHLGQIISQNSQGDLLGHVKDMEAGKFTGGGYYEAGVRGHRTNALLTPHTDSSDLVGLMCVRPAKEGGESWIASSIAVYNRIREARPDLLEPLLNGFRYDLIGKGRSANELSNNRIPVYSWCENLLSCRFNKQQIELGAKRAEELLTETQQEAIDLVEDLAVSEDFLLPMAFEPGDIQLLNNHTTMHSRGRFLDWEEQEKRRLLLRLWVNIPNGRPLAPDYADRLNTGGRGGVTKRL